MSFPIVLSEDRFKKDLLALMERCGTKCDPEAFIAQISNVYHRIESNNYDEVHTEILHEENTRLRRLLLKTIDSLSVNRLRAIDVGCGTGHASKILVSTCSSKEVGLWLVGIDLSMEMLSNCQSIYRKEELIKFSLAQGGIEIIKTGEDTGFDLVITSSVLHHIPNVYRFAQHISSILRPGGIWLMSHEPNGFDSIAKLQMCRDNYARLLSLQKRIRRKLSSTFNFCYSDPSTKPQILDVVSQALLDEDVTHGYRLTRREVRGLIDIHTINPHPGSFNIGYDGFSISNISENFAKFGLDLIHDETYSHLGLVRSASIITKILNLLFQFMFPESGTIISCLWKKTR